MVTLFGALAIVASLNPNMSPDAHHPGRATLIDCMDRDGGPVSRSLYCAAYDNFDNLGASLLRVDCMVRDGGPSGCERRYYGTFYPRWRRPWGWRRGAPFYPYYM